MIMNSYLIFITLALAIIANVSGGGKQTYLGYKDEADKAIKGVDGTKAGKLVQCVNWAKQSSSELIKKLTHDSGLHLFSKNFPACPINHKYGKFRGRPKKDENGVLVTSKDSLEMCQTIGKLMELGRLPPDVAGIGSSDLVLLNVGAATSRATDMHVAHWLGFESFNFEWNQYEFDRLMEDWKGEFKSSPRAHVIKRLVGHIEGGTATVQMEKPKKKKQKKADAIEVKAVSLDYAMNNYTKKTVAFLHIDVKDQEYEVLKGAYGILQADKPAIFFQHSANMKATNGKDTGSHALCLLKTLGYDCGFVDHSKSANVICTNPDQYHYKPTIEKGKPKKGGKKEENKDNKKGKDENKKEKDEKKDNKKGNKEEKKTGKVEKKEK